MGLGNGSGNRLGLIVAKVSSGRFSCCRMSTSMLTKEPLAPRLES